MNVNVKTINVSLNNYMYDAIEIKSRGFLGELTIICIWKSRYDVAISITG